MNAISALMRTMGNKKAKHTEYKRIVDIKSDSKKGSIIDSGITNMTVTEIVHK